MKYLLDAGHGGMAFGHYLTKGKRSPEVPPGIYEGEFNRKICEMLNGRPCDSVNLWPGPINVPLGIRVRAVNEIARLEPNCCLISIHANAAGKRGWSGANGFVVFRPKKYSARNSKNYHDSVKLSECMVESMSELGFIKRRGTGIKEAEFTIISRVNCPAILIECGFMTNRNDAEVLRNYHGRSQIAWAIFAGMKAFEAHGAPIRAGIGCSPMNTRKG